MNNLAGVLQDLGDMAGARAGFERALAIDEAAYGPEPIVVTIRPQPGGLPEAPS